jgi:NTE family protein
MKKRRVALVLAGGGARGVAHIGAIEELERQGFEISAVAGTSMGALVGGVYASNRSRSGCAHSINTRFSAWSISR